MDGTFLALVAAYLFAEFPLQPLADDKPFAFWPFALHLVTVVVVTSAVLGGWLLTLWTMGYWLPEAAPMP